MEIKASAEELAYLMKKFKELFFGNINIKYTLEIPDSKSEEIKSESDFSHIHITENNDVFIDGHRIEDVTSIAVRPDYQNHNHTVTIKIKTPYVKLDSSELLLDKSEGIDLNSGI